MNARIICKCIVHKCLCVCVCACERSSCAPETSSAGLDGEHVRLLACVGVIPVPLVCGGA